MTLKFAQSFFLFLSLLFFTGCSIPPGASAKESQKLDKTGKKLTFQKSPKQSPPLYDVRIEKDLSYLEPDRAEKFDLYAPADGEKNQRFPAIVIIHGGGWVAGQKDAKREQHLGTTLAQHGYLCISINYLLGKKGGTPVWPQNLYDCKSAVQFLRQNADRYHVNPNYIGVIGGSAGGHLAAMVGLTGPDAGLEPPGPYNNISSRVQAVIDLYGITNVMTWPKGSAQDVLGAAKDQNPNLWKLASPVNQVTPDDPPFLILHGTADKTVAYQQSVELHKKLRGKNVPSQLILIYDAPHTFRLWAQQRDLMPMIINFFDRHLKPNTQ